MKPVSGGDRAYLPRLVEPRLAAMMASLPAVLLTGPRATGKTTTGRRYAASVVRLDREADAIAFRADPDAALRNLPEPVLLDEWQAVPEVLAAVKRAVDEDPRPGRFLLTGSVRADLEAATWPGTGRVVRLLLYGLTVQEQRGSVDRPSLLRRLAGGGIQSTLDGPADPPDLQGYLDLALCSGFPEPAVHLESPGRTEWLDGYLDQLLTRDVYLVDAGRDPERLRRYLTAYASVTATVTEDKALWEAAGINRKTAIAYEQLLQNLFVVQRLPAWSTNVLKQLVRSPKRHVVDPALAAAILGLDAVGVLRHGHLLGSILESFAVAQLRAEAAAIPRAPRLYHLRTAGGRHEVDLVVEMDHGTILGVEIKAAAAPKPHDARHLIHLREVLGDRFAGGLLLHTGPYAFEVDHGIVAVPIATLWS